MNKTIVSACLLVAFATTSASVQDVPKTNHAIQCYEKDIGTETIKA